jgi:peptidoglycan/LPS O-acetylase OafA/YrhL
MSTETTDLAAVTTEEWHKPDQRSVSLSEAGRERLPFIDALRLVALAAVCVSYLRAIAPAAFGSPAGWVARAVTFGSHGVDLFFALSAFCLAYPASCCAANAASDSTAPDTPPNASRG